ncbi:MAG: TonB-dependent receptor, partial [Porphyrobacter sp.]|nr:TonB-dependent receptor [Porphyrobacter sp.]
QRLRGADGTVDPQRLAQMRERLCRADGAPDGAGRGAAAGGEPGGRASAGERGQRGGGAGRGGGPGFMGRGGDGRGRWSVNLTYSYEIDNTVLVAPGGPLLDLLDGDALAGGGQPRHAATLQGGLFYRGYGARFSGEYTGASRVDGSGLPGSTDLAFGDFVTFDIRLFADLNQRERLVEAVPLLEGVRVSFSIDNIFDARQRVTDGSGAVPLRYQPFLVDPVGRLVEIELRKLF